MFCSRVPSPTAIPSFYAATIYKPALPLSADRATVTVPPQLLALLPVSIYAT